MREYSLSELKAQRDAIDKRIAGHKPLLLPVAIKKVRTYATEHGMTEDDLFPPREDPNADPYASDIDMNDPRDDPDYFPFPKFHYEDTFGYTFIEDLKIQRAKVLSEIRSIRREAIGRARAFIHEYKLTKEDICPNPCLANKNHLARTVVLSHQAVGASTR